MLPFVQVPPWTSEQELKLLPNDGNLLAFVHALRGLQDPVLQPIASNFTLRQMIRMSKRLQSKQSTLLEEIHRVSLYPFLPSAVKETLDGLLKQQGIAVDESRLVKLPVSLRIDIAANTLRIGDTQLPIRIDTQYTSLVPKVNFQENSSQLKVMKQIMQVSSWGALAFVIQTSFFRTFRKMMPRSSSETKELARIALWIICWSS